MLHYHVSKFFGQILVSPYQEWEKDNFYVYVINDNQIHVTATLQINIYSWDGLKLYSSSSNVTVNPLQSETVYSSTFEYFFLFLFIFVFYIYFLFFLYF